MKRLLLIAATLALATSAFAWIGESPEQIVRDAQHDKDTVGMHYFDLSGRTALEVRYRNGATIKHVFGTNRLEIAFYFSAPKGLSNAEIARIQRTFHTTWHALGNADGISSWESASGLLMGVQHFQTDDSDYLMILDSSKLSEIPGPKGRSFPHYWTLLDEGAIEIPPPVAQGQEVRRAKPLPAFERYWYETAPERARINAESASIERQLKSRPQTWEALAEQYRLLGRLEELNTRMKAIEDEAERLNHVSPAIAPEIAFESLVPQLKPPDKNDCLIVATETYARLKNTAYWARIAGFDYSANTRNTPGHAVVLYQPTQGSTVWLYDEVGSRDLATKSHDLNELKEAISLWLKGDARVVDIKWIGEETRTP
jgi:hypothetical protein